MRLTRSLFRALGALGGPVASTGSTHDVRRCPVCRGRAPCPIQWEPAGDDHWWIRLRCGACGHWYETTISNERAKRLDAELDADAAAIRHAAERTDHERMSGEIETFVAALRCGAITPDDFDIRNSPRRTTDRER